MTNGVARFDGRSLAIVEPPALTVPEAGGPASSGQAGPYVMLGLRTIEDPLAPPPAPSNAFAANLSGAARVRLDLVRMDIDPGLPIDGSVTNDEPLNLRLDGAFNADRSVSIDGADALTVSPSGGVLEIPLGPGSHQIVVQ
jgi:hypothetical protein